jgi:hypothetical protein
MANHAFPKISVKILMTQNYIKQANERIKLGNETIIFRECPTVQIPVGTIVEYVPKRFKLNPFDCYGVEFEHGDYRILDHVKRTYIPKPTFTDIYSIMIPAGTVIIPELGAERILALNTKVILPDRCAVQILPGTILQNVNRPEKYMSITEPLDVYIRSAQYELNAQKIISYPRKWIMNIFRAKY